MEGAPLMADRPTAPHVFILVVLVLCVVGAKVVSWLL
jgi:hypothetical protein